MISLAILALAAPAAVAGGPAWLRPETFARYVRAGDYPREAWRRHEEGRVRFELSLSPQGRVGDCRILESSGSAALDGRTCAILRQRARFAPGGGIVRSEIAWRLPERSLALISPRPYQPPRFAGRGYIPQ